MNIYQLKTAIASAFLKSVDDLMVNDQDLGLLALNQVRQLAEQVNDFEFNHRLLTLNVDGVTGGSLETAVLFGTNEVRTIKTLVDVGLGDGNGNFIPVEWTTSMDTFNRQRMDNPYTFRYPTDGQAMCGPIGQKRFVFHRNNVSHFPAAPNTTFNLLIDAYVMSPDWVDADAAADAVGDGEWLLNGYTYLQWAAIVHMNEFFKGFVFRQEGNLPPPETLRDNALNAMITWQVFKYEQYRRHSR